MEIFLSSDSRHLTLRLLILLSLCCGILAECSTLQVRLGEDFLDVDSICLRRYRTPECKKFVTTFNQDDLPDGYPRSPLSVDRPSDIRLLGLEFPYKDMIYPGISVRWKSPTSALGRQKCNGYLVVWVYRGSSDIYCQLFQLNTTNNVLHEELNFQYDIARVHESSLYTVSVYSMPPYGAEELVSQFITTPPVIEVASKGVEPALWSPFITYETFLNGTLLVMYTLPPPNLNLTRFALYIVNMSDLQHPLYALDQRPQGYSNLDPQTQVALKINRTGCYEIVIWVMEEEGFHKVEGKCSCWTYVYDRKTCHNTCGSSLVHFCMNVTQSVTGGTLSPTQVTPGSGGGEAAQVSSTMFNSQVAQILAGILFGLMLIVVLLFFVVNGLRKTYKGERYQKRMSSVKPQKHESIHEEPQRVNDMDANVNWSNCNPVSDRLNDFSMLSPLIKKIVYVLYAGDHQPHKQLVESFIRFLEVHCFCKVISPACYNGDGSGAFEWFISNIKVSDYIIFLNSEGAENLILAYMKNKTYDARKSTLEEGFFHLGLKYLMMNKEARDGNLILVSFQGKHCQKYLEASEIYMFPEHLPHLLQKIHNLNGKSAKAYDNLLPMQVENISSLPEGDRLLSDIKAVKEYEESNPSWFEKSFGTLQFSSEDSGYSSVLSNRIGSVSTQDLSFGDTGSPVSVFQQPYFAHYLDTGVLLDQFGPQALEYSRFLVQTQRCSGNSISLSEKELREADPCVDPKNFDEKLSCVTDRWLSFNEAVREMKVDEIKLETVPFDEVSIVPPESLSRIVYDNYSAALANINKSEDVLSQYLQPPTNCDANSICYELKSIEPVLLAGLELNPPEALSDIQEDSVSSALRDINTNTEKFSQKEMQQSHD